MLLEVRKNKIVYKNPDPKYAHLFRNAYNMDNLKIRNEKPLT